jgi:hypothetical protein
MLRTEFGLQVRLPISFPGVLRLTSFAQDFGCGLTPAKRLNLQVRLPADFDEVLRLTSFTQDFGGARAALTSARRLNLKVWAENKMPFRQEGPVKSGAGDGI